LTVNSHHQALFNYLCKLVGVHMGSQCYYITQRDGVCKIHHFYSFINITMVIKSIDEMGYNQYMHINA
jgi:hypothetical protein